MLKINQILSSWKNGDVHGLVWLGKFGADRKLAYKYCKSGYLEKLAPCAYYFASISCSLQMMSRTRL
jgi:hypothetical protein